jgi:ADP-ribosyl-[dinitrogen reductase] hydrolase
MDVRERFRGCLLGLAVGDAVGTTVEFEPRSSFTPLTDMLGGGPFQLKAGQWTDDTSMALCLAASLVEMGDFDAIDQMNRYCKWFEQGYMSSIDYCFNIGNTVRSALVEYKHTGNPFSGATNRMSAGNGSLMRLAPIPIFYYPDREKIRWFSGESSRTTHGANEAAEACQLFGDMLYRAFSGAEKDEILFSPVEYLSEPALQAIAHGDYQQKSINQIRGTGYVVASLEAAVWCFWKAETYKDAVLAAANLGDDADTTAAICGQIAGAYYGEKEIPSSWLQKLAKRKEIVNLANKLRSFS